MTAIINAAPLLDPESLQFAVFEKIRRIGADHADGAMLTHNGAKYAVTVDAPCKLELIHVVIELKSGPAAGTRQAMAVLCMRNQDRHDVNGLGLLVNALASGVTITDATRPQYLSWRVLPLLPVPDCYAPSETTPDNSLQG